MSSQVDDRVVGMRFDNSKFAPGVNAALGLLSRLKASIAGMATAKVPVPKTGVEDMQKSVNGFNMRSMGVSIDGISSKFLAMSTIAITALTNITNRAINAGTNIAKALTVSPVSSGFKEYETNMNSIQTILANTSASGATLKDVNAALGELNTYSDKTIYNFAEMAKNIGTFTAAGVDLKTATGSIKGIANLAAVSGSNSEQASTAMYQLSQAISAGRVGLQDWNSVVNAGMGGTVFQRALAQTAERMGTLDAGAVKLTGKMKNATINGKSFRESITAKPGEQSWLTGKVLTETLNQFTGDMTNAQLKAKGYTDQQIKSIQAQAKMAVGAATEVKTLSGLYDTLKESAGSGWSQSFQLLFGDFGQAKSLFTGLSNSIGGIIGKSAAARNKVLKDWNELGGRTELITALKTAADGLMKIVRAISAAFRDVFPKKTGDDLEGLTAKFLEFTKKFQAFVNVNQGSIFNTFRGLFGIFGIGVLIIKKVLGVIGDLFGMIGGSGASGILTFTARIGLMISNFLDALKAGEGLNNFFSGLTTVLGVPIRLIQALGTMIKGLFSGNSGAVEGFKSSLSGVGDKLGSLSQIGDTFSGAWKKVSETLQKVKEKIQPFLDILASFGKKVKEALSEAFSTVGYDDILKTLQTVLLGGIVILLKKFFANGINIDAGGGFLGKIGETFEAVTGNLKAMQTSVKAGAILKIAIALGILAISLLVMSTIDPKKLVKALQGVGIAMGILLAAMFVLTKIAGSAGFIKIPLLAASMMLLATAVLILSASVKIMASMDWETMQRGLQGVGIAMGIMVGAAILLSKFAGGFTLAAIGILALSVGLLVMSKAVKLFGEMDFDVMKKGLLGVAAALVIIGVAVSKMPLGMASAGLGILAIGIGIKSLAKAIAMFAGMSFKELAKGMTAMAIALVIIIEAVKRLPPGMAATGAGLMVVAIALRLVASAVAKMGGLSLKVLAKGLIGLAGAMLIMSVAANAMSGSIAGAIAFGILAASTILMAKALQMLSGLSLSDLGMALLALAGVLGVMGLAAALLAPLAPVLLLVGAGLLMIGGAIALVGAGVFLLTVGFSTLAAIGAGGVAVISAALAALIAKLPGLMTAFAQGLVNFIMTIANATPGMVGAFAKILIALMDAFIQVLPKFVVLMGQLITALINVLNQNLPRMVTAGLQLLVKLLQGVAQSLPSVIKAASDVIVAFLQGVGNNIGRIIDAGIKLAIKFINGLADGIRNNQDAVIKAVGNLGRAIMEGLWNAISSLSGWLIDKIKGVLGDAWDAVTDFLGIGGPSRLFGTAGTGIVMGLANAVDANANVAVRSATSMVSKVHAAVTDSLSTMNDDMMFQPTITPVLDLTNVQKDASGINGLFGSSSVNARGTASMAQVLANSKDMSIESQEASPKVETVQHITVEQNNYSPKALSSVDIYRNTKNQIALTKEALKQS